AARGGRGGGGGGGASGGGGGAVRRHLAGGAPLVRRPGRADGQGRRLRRAGHGRLPRRARGGKPHRGGGPAAGGDGGPPRGGPVSSALGAPMSQLAQRLAALQSAVREACREAGRPEDSVELLAVSKLQPLAAVREAYAAGVRGFGENYAQELRDKSAALSDLPGIRWHAIGPLQTNKAKYVARAAHVFHALDRADVAEELSRRRTGAPLDVYLEV